MSFWKTPWLDGTGGSCEGYNERGVVEEEEGDEFIGDPSMEFCWATPETGRAGRMERVDTGRGTAAASPTARLDWCIEGGLGPLG